MYYTAQARRILGGGGVDKHLESYYIVPKFPRRYYYYTLPSVSVAASSTAVQCSRGTRRLVTRSTQSPMLLHGNAIWTNETWVI